MLNSIKLLMQRKLDEAMEDRRRAKGDADALKNQSKVSFHACMPACMHGVTAMSVQSKTCDASITWCAWHPGMTQSAVQSAKTMYNLL